MELIYLVGFGGWMVAALKWADWKRYTEFRATIYAMIIGDFLYNHLTKDYRLWTYESPYFHLTHNIINIMVAFLIFPLVVMIFLSCYPQRGIGKQVVYNLLFITIFFSNECLAHWLDVFAYHRGWNLGWSLFLDVLIFPFLRLHQKRPIWGVLVFSFCSVLFSVHFRLPIIFEQ